MGIGALVTVFLIITQFRFALLVFAAAVILLVMIGFCVPSRSVFPLCLPALSEEADGLPAGIEPQPYPQVFVFRAELRNLAVLVIAPLYSIALAMWVIVRPGLDLNGLLELRLTSALMMRLAGMISSLSVLLAWHWFSERMLLFRGAVRLGILHARMDDGEFSYEYFDTAGARQGGTAFPFGKVDTVVTPVFVNEKKGERSKPGFGFLFHRFAVTDSFHLPEQRTAPSGRETHP